MTFIVGQALSAIPDEAGPPTLRRLCVGQIGRDVPTSLLALLTASLGV